MFEDSSWDPAIRQKSADNVYDSITVLEKLANAWNPDPNDTPERQAELKKRVYDTNLEFLKNALASDYYEGYLDAKRVEDAIAAAEANPPEGGGGEG